MGCQDVLQGIFLTQESNLSPPHHKQILYPLSHRESPKRMVLDLESWLCHYCPILSVFSILEGMDKEDMIHIYNAILLSHACMPSRSVVSDPLWPHGLQPTRFLCPWVFSRQEDWSGIAMPSSRGSSQRRDWTQVSCIAGGSLTIWATRETQECWSGSLSLLPGIFPTQEVNWGLLHCRWIPYQLSYHLLSYKKEQNCVICKDMDGPRDCHTEWSKSEREKHIY